MNIVGSWDFPNERSMEGTPTLIVDPLFASNPEIARDRLFAGSQKSSQ